MCRWRHVSNETVNAPFKVNSEVDCCEKQGSQLHQSQQCTSHSTYNLSSAPHIPHTISAVHLTFHIQSQQGTSHSTYNLSRAPHIPHTISAGHLTFHIQSQQCTSHSTYNLSRAPHIPHTISAGHLTFHIQSQQGTSHSTCNLSSAPHIPHTISAMHLTFHIQSQQCTSHSTYKQHSVMCLMTEAVHTSETSQHIPTWHRNTKEQDQLFSYSHIFTRVQAQCVHKIAASCRIFTATNTPTFKFRSATNSSQSKL